MRTLAVRLLPAAILLGALLHLPGCAMYSETRHKQALAAKDAWGKVDLEGQLRAARRNQAALLEEQLRTVEAMKRADRDATALSMVLGGSLDASLLTAIKHELGPLAAIDPAAGNGSTKAASLLLATDEEQLAQGFLKKVEHEFLRFGLEMPTCASIFDGSARQSLDTWIVAHRGPVGDSITASLTAAQAGCKRVDDAKKGVDKVLDGPLKKTMTAIAAASKELEDSQKAGVDQRNRYRAAASELESAMKELAVDPKAAQKKVDTALGRMQDLAEGLSKLPDAFSSKFISEARVQSLNTVVTTVETYRKTGTTPENATTTARVLAQFPDLYDQTRSALADAQKPRLAHLVLMKNLEQVRADAAARDVESQLAKARLLREKLKWELKRLAALRDAHDYLTSECGKCLSWTLADALSPVSESELAKQEGKALVEAKANVLRAASLYLDYRGRLAAAVEQTQFQITALDHERALAHAEGNIAQWNTLISSMISQMNDFGETGIKGEHIAALINSVALLWIGKGVN